MTKTFLSAAAACMLVSAGALAQNATKTEPAQTDNATQTASAAQTDSAAQKGGMAESGHGAATMSLRQDMKDSLQKAGFSNVRVVPDSFLVQAKDKDGHPVAMIINPHSMTEVVDEGTVGQTADNSATGNAGAGKMYAPYQEGAGTFTEIPKQDKLSSSIVGLSVYNDQNQDIGTIKDIAYANHHVAAYVVGVGGFLGMGDHYVAIQPAAVQLNWDQNAKQWHAKVAATADQLKSAPAFVYPTNS